MPLPPASCFKMPISKRKRPRIAVLGSVHMDLIAQAQRLPGIGESVTGHGFTMVPGGKAGNQACQCAKLGADTVLISQLGDDVFGDTLLAAMQAHGVDTSHVLRTKAWATGASTVFAAEGDYSSIIYPGAAQNLSVEQVMNSVFAVASCDALILQLELPFALCLAAAQAAKSVGIPVVFNASPAPSHFSDVAELLPLVSTLIVNRVEAKRLTGQSTASDENLLRTLADLGPKQVVITLGSQGAIGWNGATVFKQPAYAVDSKDAVGAGDAFLGTFVTQFSITQDFATSLRLAAAAGAMATQQTGALGSLATFATLEVFIASRT
jgi:ribokinase